MFSRKREQDEPEQKEPLWRRQTTRIIETQIARFPFLIQLRAVWRQLQDERELWPYLIPLLVVVFVGTYRVERRKVLAQKRGL